MKTLVIHPNDPTTDFLKAIYEDKDWKVIDYNPGVRELKDNIKNHERIVMLGHGSKKGLFGFDKMIIDSRLVYLLREKIGVYIWCNANEFVEKYKLKGFYTGMIISDYIESKLYCIYTKDDQIFESNVLFAESIGKGIDEENMLKEVQDSYRGDTDIIDFNSQNLFQNDYSKFKNRKQVSTG